MNNNEFYNFLEEKRKERNITKSEMSRKLGYTGYFWDRTIKDKNFPSCIIPELTKIFSLNDSEIETCKFLATRKGVKNNQKHNIKKNSIITMSPNELDKIKKQIYFEIGVLKEGVEFEKIEENLKNLFLDIYNLNYKYIYDEDKTND